jgi:signal transduction histidine kinase
MSILENSIKYSKSGELIHIRFDDYNEKTSIKITSTGPYIEENEQEKIFEKEFRGKYAKEKNIEGQGIGLYTSKLVAKTNNCEIIFSSKQLNFLFEKTPMAENTFNIVINRF